MNKREVDHVMVIRNGTGGKSGIAISNKPATVSKTVSSMALVGQVVKNLPAMRQTWERSLGWEDPREKGMTTHSSILAWRIPWTEEPGGLPSMGSQRVSHD